MQSMIAVLRAAHCRSVHHFFAIDALGEVQSEKGHKLARLLLAHFSQYLAGAKDPDTAFKDFQNHVVHVQDNFWGGAASIASKWLNEAYRHLHASQWSEAAYDLGVLSHYFTDPWMPLHTGQTPRETVYHRPLEWSICCAYDEIFQLALATPSLESFEIPQTTDWIKDAIHAGAILSNKFYDALLDDYNINESRVNPPLALGTQSKQILSQLFTWVLTGWGGAIDRIASECRIDIPHFALLWPTLLASSKLPVARLTKSIACSQQRREVEAILQEYLSTGDVKRNRTEEQVTVAKVRARQPNLGPPAQEQERARALPIVVQLSASPKPSRFETSADDSPRSPVPLQPQKADPPRNTKPMVVSRVDPDVQTTMSLEEPIPIEPDNQAIRSQRLTGSSPVVDAPAIGPKTAVRLRSLGIETIDDLLMCDSQIIALQLKTSWIKASTIDQWKTQARLACEIDGLSAAGAGLLGLAGMTSSDDILRLTAEELHQLVLTVSTTAEGQRILRSKSPPPIKAIQKWQSVAQSHVNSPVFRK